jgi:predicted MFS family arabinose efflux permease
MARRIFYGWWMVGLCLLVALIGWGLGLFGSSVYLHALVAGGVASTATVSGAITLFFLIGALVQLGVGPAMARLGPGPVVLAGAMAMAAGVGGIGQATGPSSVYAAFALIGLGWACLSTTAVSTALAPWFDRHQGRAVALALIGASLANMLAAPALLAAITTLGFAMAMAVTAGGALVLLGPVAVLMRRNPAVIGQVPDGTPAATSRSDDATRWRRADALATPALRSVIIAFSLGLLVQIGLITHHVSLLAPVLGASGAAGVVTATGASALAGRLFPAQFADRMDVRVMAIAVLLLGTASLAAMAAAPGPTTLSVASVAFGFTIGNVTTLSPIIVRREFGADSFGAIYGAAASVIQLISALGPAAFGVLRDLSGGYALPLGLGAGCDLIAAAALLWGRHADHSRP